MSGSSSANRSRIGASDGPRHFLMHLMANLCHLCWMSLISAEMVDFAVHLGSSWVSTIAGVRIINSSIKSHLCGARIPDHNRKTR